MVIQQGINWYGKWPRKSDSDVLEESMRTGSSLFPIQYSVNGQFLARHPELQTSLLKTIEVARIKDTNPGLQ